MGWMWCDYKWLQRRSLSSGHNSHLATAGGCGMEKYFPSFWMGNSWQGQSHCALHWHPTCSKINVIIAGDGLECGLYGVELPSVKPELNSRRSPLMLCKQQSGTTASGYTRSCFHLLFVSGLMENVNQYSLALKQGLVHSVLQGGKKHEVIRKHFIFLPIWWG